MPEFLMEIHRKNRFGRGKVDAGSMSLIHRELPGFSKAEDPLSICQEKKESRL
jgi:hypothetical protein